MNRRFVLFVGLALLSGCATAAPKIVAPSGAPFAELEPFYAVTAGRHALTISVASNGCTRREDFAFYLERRGDASTLAFGRKRLDTCKSFAMGKVELAWTYEELGVAPGAALFLLNPVYAWTGPGS